MPFKYLLNVNYLIISGFRFSSNFRLVFLALALFVSIKGYAQENEHVEWDTLGPVQPYSFSYLNSDNGLLQNEITDILFHPKSRILWLATQQGLVRYTGRTVEVLTAKNDQYLQSTRIRDIYNFRDSMFIVYGDDHNLCQIAEDGINLMAYQPIPEGFFYCLKGNIAPRSGFLGLTYNSLIANNTEAYAIMDRRERIGYTGDRKNKVPLEIDLGFYFLNHSFAIGDTIFGFNPLGYLMRLDKEKVDTLGFFPSLAQGVLKSDVIRVIWKRSYDSGYLVYSKNLYEFIMLSSGKLSIRLIARNIPNHEYSACYYSKEDSKIYLGTRRNGLLILSPKVIKQVFNKDFYEGDYNNYALGEIGQDSVISADGVIFTPDKIDLSRRFQISSFWYPLAVDLESKRIYVPKEHKPGYIDLTDWQYHRDESLPWVPDLVMPGVVVKYKNLYYTYLQHRGMYVRKSTGWELICPAINDDIVDVSQIRFASDSLVWMTYRGGACSLDLRNGKTQTLKKQDGFLSGRALSLIDGRAWYSMYGMGLFIQDGDSSLWFSPKEYPELEVIHSIVPKGNKVLFSTNSGLFEFYKDDVLNYAFGKMAFIQAYAFGSNQGLEEKEFNGGCEPSYLVLRDGKLAFPNFTGLSFFQSDFDAYHEFISPNVAIKSVKYNAVDTIFGDSIVVDPQFNSLSFSLINPYFGDPFNARVYYRVPQLGLDWRLIDFSKGIEFDRLPSNEVYSIELFFPGLEEAERVRTLVTFTVRPRFFETPMFYFLILLGFVVLLLLILLFVSRRNKKQKNRLNLIIEERTSDLARNNANLVMAVQDLERSQNELESVVKMRNKMITVFSHDIRGPLRFLADIAGSLKSRVEESDDKEYLQELEVLADGAKGAYLTANNVLEWIRSDDSSELNQEQSLKDSINRVLSQKRGEFAHYKVEAVLNLEVDLNILAGPKTLDIIVENVIQNALKYCKSRIELNLRKDEKDDVILEIIDDGGGVKDPRILERLNAGVSVTSAPAKRGNPGAGVGLMMVREILQRIGGHIHFSNTSQGFSVAIVFA